TLKIIDGDTKLDKTTGFWKEKITELIQDISRIEGK
ncbi:unnamed protein product, partial [marine sediment metagenome]